MKKKILIGIVAVIIAIGVIGSFGGDKKETSTASNSVTQEVAKVTEEPKKEVDESVPMEYKSALAKAESYANGLDMSKKSVYKQLTSEYGEGFPKEAAQYAIDNVVADWNENALNKANSYANDQYMSKKSVYEQLISEYGEQFTKEEADYAISKVEANWKENALNKAISYQQDMNMSRKSVYNQLVSDYGEKFTKEEADYALENLPK